MPAAIPIVIIVTGPPCAGKTTLAKRIAKKLNLICLSRDWFKELLFNNLGWSDRNWFIKVGKVSLELLYYVSSLLMFSKQSFVIDSTFDAKKVRKKFLQLKYKHHYIVF